MKEVDQYIFKLKSLKSDLLAAAEHAVESNASEIEDLNLKQLNDGEDSKGVDITPPYTAFTKILKAAKGQPTNRVTLRDTGDFYRGIKLKKVGEVYDLSSTDSKTTKLVTKYGPDIIGLSDDNRDYVIEEIIKPALQQRIKELL